MIQLEDGKSEYTLVGFADSEGSGGRNSALVQHLGTPTVSGTGFLFPGSHTEFEIHYGGASDRVYFMTETTNRANFFFSENPHILGIYHINSDTKFWTSGINKQGGTTLVVASTTQREEDHHQLLNFPTVESPAYPFVESASNTNALIGYHTTTSENARKILGEAGSLLPQNEYPDPNFLFQHAGLYADVDAIDNDVPMAWGMGSYFFTHSRNRCNPLNTRTDQVRTMLRCELSNVDQFVIDTAARDFFQLSSTGRLEDRKNVYNRWQVWVHAISKALNSKKPGHSKLATQAITEMIRMHDVRLIVDEDILVVMRPREVIRKCRVVEADYKCP